MQIAGLILNQMLQFFLMLLFGFILVKSRLLGPDDSKILSTLSIYLVLPCVIVNAFQVELTKETSSGLLLAFGAACITHFLLVSVNALFRRLFHLDPVEQASVIYSNAGNMIIPIVSSVLGPEWVLYSSAFVSVQILFLWVHCKGLLCGESRPDLRKLLRNINVWAILAGIFLFIMQIHLPVLVSDTFSSIGNLMAPLGMIVMGMLLAGSRLSTVFGSVRVYLVAGLRLLVCPLLVLALFTVTHAAAWLPKADIILFISFLACTTPASATITQMAQVYGKDAQTASSVNLVTTVCCLATMPVLAQCYWLVTGTGSF